MRSVSPETTKLIEELNESPSLWEKLKGSRDDVTLLAKVGNSSEPAAIIDIVPFSLSEELGVATAAADAVHKLMLMIPVTDLPWLDWMLRRRSPYVGRLGGHWHELLSDELDSFTKFGDASVSLLGVTSFHGSGYVREEAVKRLSLIRTGAELPFLLLRLNDWVSNVRDAAYTAVRFRLKPPYCRRFIANLSLISRVEQAGRADQEALIQAINGLLQSDECRPALLEALKSEDRLIRRATFKLAGSREDDLPEVVKQALNDRDTVIRLWAARRVSSALEGERHHQLLQLMKRDPFMPVRREALRTYFKRNSQGSVAELRAALLDRHQSIREEARYHLRKTAPMDFAAFYRQYLLAEEEGTLYSAISGFGETGSPADDQLIMSYTSHRIAKIRRAAIRALGKLHPEAHIDLFMRAIKDEVPRVSRQALKALVFKTSLVPTETVWEILCSAAHRHGKRNALALLAKLAKWDSIYYLVRALCDPDETIAEMSRFGIQRWLARFNSNFSVPTLEQLGKLRAALEDCGELLDQETTEQLRFSMKGF